MVPLLLVDYSVDCGKFVNLFGVSSKTFEISSGACHGGHLSPFLFNIFIDAVFLNKPSHK